MKFSLRELFLVVTAAAVFFALLRYSFVSANPVVGAVAIVILLTAMVMTFTGMDQMERLSQRLILSATIALFVADFYALGARLFTLLGRAFE